MYLYLIPVFLGVLFVGFLISLYKVARIDKALIITGGKKPKIIVAGGDFVIPIFQKYSFFDLCMITIEAKGDEIYTATAVPVVVDWTAQIRPNADDSKQLETAAMSFLERSPDAITRDVKLTLDGGVREVVSSLTPEQVLREKDKFSELVKKSVVEEMANMGFKLVSLNIQEVTDRNGYFINMAAKDREQKRLEAENIQAAAEQAIREKKAESERIAREAELSSDIAIAEKERNNSIKKADMKTETDTAQANADIAGKLQATVRARDLATQEGQVEVERQIQSNFAAQKKREIIQTEAEAEKMRVEIEAAAAAEKAKIVAAANASVMEREAAGKANAIRTAAEGESGAKKSLAEGEAIAKKSLAEAEASAKKFLAEAEAAQIQKTGQAEADVIRQKGLAEAESIKAKALAEAEGEKALSEARASNDRVNFEIAKFEIESKARVEIATAAATIMGQIGKDARFVNIGNSGNGNALFDTLMGVPALLEKLDVVNKAVSEDNLSINAELRELLTNIVKPLEALNKENKTKNIADESADLEYAKIGM